MSGIVVGSSQAIVRQASATAAPWLRIRRLVAGSVPEPIAAPQVTPPRLARGFRACGRGMRFMNGPPMRKAVVANVDRFPGIRKHADLDDYVPIETRCVDFRMWPGGTMSAPIEEPVLV